MEPASTPGLPIFNLRDSLGDHVLWEWHVSACLVQTKMGCRYMHILSSWAFLYDLRLWQWNGIIPGRRNKRTIASSVEEAGERCPIKHVKPFFTAAWRTYYSGIQKATQQGVDCPGCGYPLLVESAMNCRSAGERFTHLAHAHPCIMYAYLSHISFFYCYTYVFPDDSSTNYLCSFCTELQETAAPPPELPRVIGPDVPPAPQSPLINWASTPSLPEEIQKYEFKRFTPRSG